MKFAFVTLCIASISCNAFFFSEKVIPQNFSSCMTNPIIDITKTFAMEMPVKGQNLTFILVI